jgi:hypothetical protein
MEPKSTSKMQLGEQLYTMLHPLEILIFFKNWSEKEEILSNKQLVERLH